MSVRLRWKLRPQEKGLAAIGRGPRGSDLTDGVKKYASVNALQGGWFWVAGWDSDVPYHNSCNDPVETVEQAKEAAMAYVRKHIS